VAVRLYSRYLQLLQTSLNAAPALHLSCQSNCEYPFRVIVLTENLVSEYFGIDECKAFAKAAVQRDDLA
jgi:hypothetical protein